MIYSIKEIIEDLNKDEVVVVPTETVYGLAANAFSNKAIEKIYQIKNRAPTNPLIVHGINLQAFSSYVKISNLAEKLAQKFWPGPITFVLPLLDRSDYKGNVATISPRVTSGLNSLAIRSPSHPVFREVLQGFKSLMAAPSANPSKYISPTSIAQVEICLKMMEVQDVKYIDGGNCYEGLESTVLDLRFEDKVSILRPGPITSSDIKKILPTKIVLIDKHLETNTISPGMEPKHYSPTYRLNLNVKKINPSKPTIAFGSVTIKDSKFPIINLSSKGDLKEAAHNLFSTLYEMEWMLSAVSSNIAEYEVDVVAIPLSGLGYAINDRLKRAASNC